LNTPAPPPPTSLSSITSSSVDAGELTDDRAGSLALLGAQLADEVGYLRQVRKMEME
jgi:hypothetical protein